jgi:hypothetical protein
MTPSLRVSEPAGQVTARPLPELAVSPVMRGYPGGIADVADQDDFPVAEFGFFATRESAADSAEPDTPEATGGTVWQQSLRAWREAGIDWQRPPRGRSLDTDLQLTEPIPAVATNGAGRAGKAGADRAGTVRAGVGRKRRMAIAVSTSLVVAAVAVAGVAVARSRTGSSGSGQGPLAVSLPAVVADSAFAGGQAQPSPMVFPVLADVAADGNTVVAVGSQASTPFARPVILTSDDGGKTWQHAELRVQGSRVSPAGAAPVMVAGGHGKWLALGRKADWVSPDGRTWQPVPGLAPQAAGDRVTALARTGSGFLALGENTPSAVKPAASSPVLWTSPDGLTWRRQPAAQLGVIAPAGRLTLRWAASSGSVTMIGGELTRTAVKHSKGHTVTLHSQSPALWRSTDSGRTWAPVRLPAVSKATGGLAGLAASGSGFVAVRTGHNPAGRLDALVFESAHGSAWRLTRRLSVPHAGLHVSAVAGSDRGLVVAGTASGRRVAFVSLDGQPWHQTAGLGKLSRFVAAVTVDAAGAVVAAGAAHPGGGASQRPFLLLAWHRSWLVGRPELAGSGVSGVTVRGLAAAPGEQVAVGSADGGPGIWWAPAGGHWSPAAVTLPPSWRNGGRLDAVTAGPAGWLAVGRSGGSGPVIMTSPHGKSWRPATGAGPFEVPGITVAQVAAGPAGYVMVGSKIADGRPGPAAWYSANLASWHPARVAGTGTVFKIGEQMLAVTAAGAGFVAVGSAGKAPAVWTSPDGRRWRLAAVLHAAAGAVDGQGLAPGASAVLTGVAAEGRRVVAVGTETGSAGPKPFAAVSGDGGLTWHETALPKPAGSAAVTALAPTRGGFIALGTVGVAGDRDVIVWWSADGRSWHTAPLAAVLLRGPGAQKLTALSVSGNLLTAAGYSVTLAGEHPVLWHARIR